MDEASIVEDHDTSPHRQLAVTEGTKTVLAVRIVGPDASTTATESQLRGDVFNGVSLAGQYAACSNGRLQMVAADGYSDGVTTVTITENIVGNTNANVRTAAVNALGGGKPSGVDHVMLCIPPGTSGGW